MAEEADDRFLDLRNEPADAEVADLNARFGHLLTDGQIESSGPLQAEVDDGDRVDLPRLVLTLDQHQVGSLHTLIRAINDLDSARR